MKAPIWMMVGLLATGCATKSSGTYEVAATDGASANEAARAEADALWQERGDKDKLVAALAKYEEVYNADPTDREVATLLVRGWYFLGDAHETDKDAKLASWDTSIQWGKKCIAINQDFAGLMEKGDVKEGEAAAQVATVEDTPCLYWTASALGKWGKLSGLAKTLKHIGTVKDYVGTVERLNPEYFYGAADRYWGAYYAAAPSFAGQDLEKSKIHFEKSLAIAPEYLSTKVLMADYLMVKNQDRETFKKLLEEVVAADPNVDPDLVPENEAAQRQAKELLANIDEYFAG